MIKGNSSDLFVCGLCTLPNPSPNSPPDCCLASRSEPRAPTPMTPITATLFLCCTFLFRPAYVPNSAGLTNDAPRLKFLQKAMTRRKAQRYSTMRNEDDATESGALVGNTAYAADERSEDQGAIGLGQDEMGSHPALDAVADKLIDLSVAWTPSPCARLRKDDTMIGGVPMTHLSPLARGYPRPKSGTPQS